MFCDKPAMRPEGEKKQRTVVGSLTVVDGPMCAGKTSDLQRRARIMAMQGLSCLTVVNLRDLVRHGEKSCTDGVVPDKDDGCTSPPIVDGKCRTHHGTATPAIMSMDLASVEAHPMFAGSDAIFVDEGQFFADLVQMCLRWATVCNKHVVVSGLSSSFLGKPFQNMAELTALATDHTTYKAVCVNCLTVTATMTAKISSPGLASSSADIIDPSSSYVPLCLHCWVAASKK